MNDPTPIPGAVPWEDTYLGRLFEHSDQASRREIPGIRGELIRYLAKPDHNADVAGVLTRALATAVCWWVHGSSIIESEYQKPIGDEVVNMMATFARTASSPTAAQLDAALFQRLPEYMRKLVYPELFPEFSPITTEPDE